MKNEAGFARISGGKGQQGIPKRATRAGRCQACGAEYPKGAQVVELGGREAVHPPCAFSEVVVRSV